MTDAELLEGFETAELPNGRFHHAEHVRTAWLYLRREPVLPAIARFTADLKSFAAAKGAPGLYHETITWAYLLLIHERLAARPTETWEEFARDNPDLLVWKGGALSRLYRAETLSSDLARRVFVLPDAGESPGS
jgi:hypothetical protein